MSTNMVAAQAILWTALGLIFAPMAERLLAPGSDASSPRELVTR